MINDIIDLLKLAVLWLTCPGNNFLSQRCSEWTAGFVIGRLLVVGLAILVPIAIVRTVRAANTQKGGKNE